MGAPSLGAAAILIVFIFTTTVHSSDLNTTTADKDTFLKSETKSDDLTQDTTEDSISVSDVRDSLLTIAYSTANTAASDDRETSESKLTVPYSPPSEVESDPQPSSDRSALPDYEEGNVDAESRKSFVRGIVPKLQLAFSPDEAHRTLPTYHRRRVLENELIHLQRIPGTSTLITCTGEGEFYSVVTPWKQCMMCACVGGLVPQPVCVNCADCTNNIGLGVPLPPLTSEAIGDALLAPTLFPAQQRPLYPTVQSSQPFAVAEVDILQTRGPNLLPQLIQTTQSPVLQACTPLPTGEAFQHPFNPCQTCICQTTLSDVQILCIENAQCVVPPTEGVSIPQLPLTTEPVSFPRCATMPFNVPFPHPTDPCKRCQCVEQVTAFNIREPQLRCVQVPGCGHITTSLHPTSIATIEEVLMTESNAFGANLPEMMPVMSTESVFTPIDIVTTDITVPISSQVPPLPQRPYFTPELISADAYLAPSFTNTVPVSPGGGFIIPQKPSVSDKPHEFAVAEIEESVDVISYTPLGVPNFPKSIDLVNLKEPLPWPPILRPSLPNKLEGPLLGPTPHKSCQPYPPNKVFQHPWDECQVCRCSEYHALGHTSVEVNCFTKASCCATEEEMINRGITTQGIQQLDAANAISLVPSVTIQDIIAKDKVFYLEPKCRMRPPNQPFVVDCNLCECRVLYHFVVAKCTPQPKCKERQKYLGRPEAILEENQSLTYSIPMNGALRPPENSEANIITVSAEAGEINSKYEPIAYGSQFYQYPSLATLTQPQLPTLSIPKYNQNFAPQFASPQMTYNPSDNDFIQQNYLLDSVDSRFTGYPYATNTVPFRHLTTQGFKENSRYLPRSYEIPNYQQWQNAYGGSFAQAQAAANAQAVANAQVMANAQNMANSQAIANAQSLGNDQASANAIIESSQKGLFPSYGVSNPMYENWRKDIRPGEDFLSSSVSGVDTSSVISESTSAYPSSTNTYPFSTYTYPTSTSFRPATTTAAYDSNQMIAQAMAGAGGRPVTKGGRGQCQFDGDMYHERCQACHCLVEPSSNQLYSLCYGTPCN